jgi:hypothetical protein
MAIRIRIVIVVSLGARVALFVGTPTGLVICLFELGKTFCDTVVICLITGRSNSIVGRYVNGLLRISRHRVEIVDGGNTVGTE